jgi:GTP-binding protein EngB required for normal cell division
MKKENIYNKENEYQKEIFDLLNDHFKETTTDIVTLNLLRNLFLTDIDDINNEEILKSLLAVEISSEVLLNETDNIKETTANKTNFSSVKKILFYDEDYENNEGLINKASENE